MLSRIDRNLRLTLAINSALKSPDSTARDPFNQELSEKLSQALLTARRRFDAAAMTPAGFGITPLTSNDYSEGGNRTGPSKSSSRPQ